MSIGLACLPRPVTAEQLLGAADEAMYVAKRAGGSGVSHAVPRTGE
jgi:GGDEF domain-containing protein